MKDKLVKTRKEHKCDYCFEIIPKGDTAIFMSYRGAVYDDGDNQIGIEYLKFYFHKDDDYCDKLVNRD